MDKTIRLPAGSAFYLRALILIMLCGALSKVISGVHQKPDDHFIEYVWAVARDISSVFDNLLVILLVYVAIVTILVVVLNPKMSKDAYLLVSYFVVALCAGLGVASYLWLRKLRTRKNLR